MKNDAHLSVGEGGAKNIIHLTKRMNMFKSTAGWATALSRIYWLNEKSHRKKLHRHREI